MDASVQSTGPGGLHVHYETLNVGDLAQDVHRDRSSGWRLSSLQATFDRQAYTRSHRPTPAVNFPHEQPYGGIACDEPDNLHENEFPVSANPKATNLKRRTSRFGLVGLFGRTKALDQGGKHGSLGIQFEIDEAAERRWIRENETSEQCIRTSSGDSDALLLIESPGTQTQHQTSKQNLKAKRSFKQEVRVRTWDSPPLFQAYPQAVKHATLRAPSLTAESIIRLHNNKNHAVNLRLDPYTSDSYQSKGPKEKKSKHSLATDSSTKGDWTHKIYVLVTTGYFLQYAGEGSFDRLPEKIMPLTTESAAFASDVLPGEPYVLQVSQVSDHQGTLDKEASRTMLKKLGLRNEMRRSTSTFLLVLEGPEEMSAWLVAVRKEIRALGGKEYKPDESQQHAIEELASRPQHETSQRYLVKRDPYRFSEKSIDQKHRHTVAIDERSNETSQPIVGALNPLAWKRQSSITQKSMESRSVSNTTASVNQLCLDRLRESPRESYASTALKTTSTSRESSPRLSPDTMTCEESDVPPGFADSPPTPSTYAGCAYGSMHKASNASAAHRMSMLTPSTKQSSLSTPQHGQTSSPAAPNFSVPTFSKRYSTSPRMPSTKPKVQAPPTALHHGSPPPLDNDNGSEREKRSLTISKHQHFRKPSPNAARGISSAENDPLSTPPHSSGSRDSPPTEADKRYSRRFSSLEYSRGISSLQLARQTPSPHPPPTAALPPLPRAASPCRASLSLPLTTALPPIPPVSNLPPCYSMRPQPTASATAVMVCEPSSYLDHSSLPIQSLGPSLPPEQPSHLSLAAPLGVAARRVSEDAATLHPSHSRSPAQEAANLEFAVCGSIRRPLSLGVRSDRVIDESPLPSPQTGFKAAFEYDALTAPLNDSPPKPTRKPPPPPPQRGHTQGRRSIPPIGREPPPVYTPVESPRPSISVSSRGNSFLGGAAHHPFIPPIRVSERKFRGSLDGPWNPSYGASQKTFLDVSVG